MAFKVEVSPDLIGGGVDEGYGMIADVFRRNMLSGDEVGAAVAVYRDGVKVVDLWGGYRNGITKAPWKEDTLVNMFSTTKGVSALAIAVAVSQGLISYDAKVADYWPTFAQASKGSITVRQLLSHQAGLPAIDTPLTVHDLADRAKMSAALAAQAPAWRPGTRHGYHAVTLGWYESELIRHADPLGRSLGQFFAQEVAKPLGLEFYIGLPVSVSRDRVGVLAYVFLGRTAAAPQHGSTTFRGGDVESVQPDRPNTRQPQRPRRSRCLQPRRRAGGRDTRSQRHRNRTVGGQSLRLRRDRWF